MRTARVFQFTCIYTGTLRIVTVFFCLDLVVLGRWLDLAAKDTVADRGVDQHELTESCGEDQGGEIKRRSVAALTHVDGEHDGGCGATPRPAARLELIADLVAPEALELDRDLIEMLEVGNRHSADFLEHGQLPLQQPVHHV